MAQQSTKVLVVDDQRDVVETVSFRLEQQGYEVLTAYNGEEALRVAREQLPELIILDVMLPKENGYLVARWLREDEVEGRVTKAPEILMLTARVVKDPERQAFIQSWTGTDHFMYKPFDLEELVQKVAEMLEATRVA